MSNHPNRGGNNTSRNPTADEIAALRRRLGLTQAQAGVLVYSSERTWQQWEAADRRMHPGLWELFQRKTDTFAG